MPKKCILLSLSSHTILGACLLLSSCASFTFSPSAQDEISISVPYAEGDDRGELTSSVVRAMASKTNLHVSNGCRYALAITILDTDKQPLAYRFKKESLTATENRVTMLAEVNIMDTYTKKRLRGPGYIQGFVDYDYQKAKDNKLNKESLGQLEDTSADRDMVTVGLYRDLANKIALWAQQQLDLLPFSPEPNESTSN